MRGAVRPWSATAVVLLLACLTSSAIRAQPSHGFNAIVDERTGIRLAIPTDIVGSNPMPQQWGSSWGSRTSHLNIDTLNYGNTRVLSEVFSTMTSKPGRTVTAQDYRDDSFYFKGNEDQGTTHVYVRMRAFNGELRGVAIAYDSSVSKRMEPIVDQIMSSFDPFAAPAAIAAVPPPSAAVTNAAPSQAPAPAANVAAAPTPSSLPATPAPVVVAAATAAPADNLPVEIVPPIPHSGNVNSAVISVDNDNFAVSSGEDGIIKLWDVATGRLIRNVARIDPELKYWRVRVLSSDGRRLLGIAGGDAVVWDTVTGRQVLIAKDVSEDDTAMTGTGSRVITRREDQSIRAFDGQTGKELSILRGATKIAFSQDGTRAVAVVAGADRTIYETNTTTGSRGAIVTTVDAPIASLRFLPGGKSLVIKMTTGDLTVWGVEQNRNVLQLKGDQDSAYAFSPDGSLLAFLGQNGTVEVFETLSGNKRSTFKVPRSNLLMGRFLHGGDQIYFADKDDSSVFIVNWQDGTVIDAKSNLPESLALGSRYFVSADEDGNLRLKDIEDGKVVRQFGGEATVDTSSFLPSGAKVAISSNKQPKIFDPQTGVVASTCASAKEDVVAVEMSKRGQLVAYAGQDKKIDLCDAVTGASVRTLAGHNNTVKALAFSLDDRQLLSGDIDGTVKLWDVQTGALIKTLLTGKEQRGINVVEFSPNGQKLFAGTDDNKIHIWDSASGKELKILRMLVGPVTAMAISPDGRRIAAGSYGQLLVKQWDIETGKELQRLETSLGGRFTSVNDLKYSPFGDGALMATANNQIEIWDTNTGSKKLEIIYQGQEFLSVSFTQDQRRVLSLDQGGVVRHWDRSTGALLLTVLSFGEGEWIALTPEGFFDASPNGASYLSAVRGLEVYSVNQFYQSLYRPDLVREKLVGDPRGLVREAAASLDLSRVISSGNAPDVRVRLPARAVGTATVDGASIRVEAEISDRGGGVGRVEWRVNGVTVGVDTPSPGNQPILIPRNLALDAGSNTIEVTAYNASNLIASVPERVDVTSQAASPSIAPASPGGPAPTQATAAAPRLFVLVAGINDYADERIKLSYAVPDANEIARGFKEAAGSLYRSVEVKLMTNAAVTKAGLDAAFAEISANASASDVFVLYLAGHGKTVDGRYYFIPQDFIIDGDFTQKTIDASVKAKAIAQEQWQAWFSSVPAHRSVILFDTCESGTLTGDAGETQLLEKGAANDRLAEATGRSILTASNGSQEALEGYHGHGLFTYEVLDAINYGDSDRNGTVDVSELAAYVYARVSELSLKVFGQRQAPQMKVTRNYPLMKQTRILQDETPPVAEAKPSFKVTQTARLQIKPSSGATVVRSLSAKTAVTVIESRDGWSLIASEGKPIGYVATKDLAPVQ
jgi:WD40 repeat protein/uncharacterized caspase-like protein